MKGNVAYNWTLWINAFEYSDKKGYNINCLLLKMLKCIKKFIIFDLVQQTF